MNAFVGEGVIESYLCLLYTNTRCYNINFWQQALFLCCQKVILFKKIYPCTFA